MLWVFTAYFSEEQLPAVAKSDYFKYENASVSSSFLLSCPSAVSSLCHAEAGMKPRYCIHDQEIQYTWPRNQCAQGNIQLWKLGFSNPLYPCYVNQVPCLHDQETLLRECYCKKSTATHLPIHMYIN